MKFKPKQSIVLDYLKREKALIIDFTNDYVEYDHLTGEKIFHGKMKEVIKIRVPYLKCTNELRIQDKKSKLEEVIQSTYYTVDGQSINETIIDVDIIATTRVTTEVNMLSCKSILRPIPDTLFNKLIGSGEVQLEKPNIEYKTLYEG